MSNVYDESQRLFRATPEECINKSPAERFALLEVLNEKFAAWFAKLSPEEQAEWRGEAAEQKKWPDPWWKNMRPEAWPKVDGAAE